MELVVAKTRKEAKILENGTKFLALFGLTLEDLVDIKKSLVENKTLLEANKRLYKENQKLKGNSTEDVEENPNIDTADLFGHKEEIK